MRFKTETRPKCGACRKIKKFAYIPLKINNLIVWLEFYEQRQVYRSWVNKWVGYHNELINKE